MTYKKVESEHDLINKFLENQNKDLWDCYPENQKWDFLMQSKDGKIQIGFQAKLRCNLKVISQCADLLKNESVSQVVGPHYIAVLVPSWETASKSFQDFQIVCEHLKIMVFTEKGCLSKTSNGKTYVEFCQTFNVHKDPLQILDGSPHYYRHNFVGKVWTPPFVPTGAAGVKSPTSVTKFKIGVVKLCEMMRKGLTPTRKEIKDLNAGSIQYWEKYLTPIQGLYPARYKPKDMNNLPDTGEYKDIAEQLKESKELKKEGHLEK